MNPIAAALLFGGESGGSSDPIVASSVTYDGTSSGLSSENVQDAIDEVNEKIEEQPNPMVYKGTLGTGGTITSLPTASLANEGYVYKVKTEDDYILDTIYYRVAFLVSTGNVSADKSMDPDFSNIVDSVSVAAPRYNGVAFVFDDNKLEVGTKDATGSFGGNIYVKSLIDGVHYNNNIYNAGEIMASGNKASNRNWGPITYGPSIHAKVGDMFISNGTEWTHIPSGDDMVIADEVTYDNTSSALTSENVQDAIDEVNNKADSSGIVPELTQAQYDALSSAEKNDGKIRVIKDRLVKPAGIHEILKRLIGPDSGSFYQIITDQYYCDENEEYIDNYKGINSIDYYSKQTGYHSVATYTTENGLLGKSTKDTSKYGGRAALWLLSGSTRLEPYSSNYNQAIYRSSTFSAWSAGFNEDLTGSNQRDGFTKLSTNMPIFETQAAAVSYITTGEGIELALNYRSYNKTKVIIQNDSIVGAFQASDMAYDNTGSGLTSRSVQGAIDEVNSKIPSDIQAEDVNYDNTTSGLTATDVNSAIDEVNDKIDNIEITAEDVSFENKVIGRLMPDNTQGVIDSIMDGYENDPLTLNHKFVIEGKVPSYGSYCYTITYYVNDVEIDSETVWLNNSSTFHGLEQHRDGSSYKFTLLDSIPCPMTFYNQRGTAYGPYYAGDSFSVGYDGASTQRLTGDQTFPEQFHSGASYVNYDNTDSDLEATDVQGAIDEVNTNLANTLKLWASDEIEANTTKTYEYGDGAYLIVGQGGVSGAKYVSFLVGYGNGASDRTINKEIMNGNSEVPGAELSISQTESKFSITPAVTIKFRIYKLI